MSSSLLHQWTELVFVLKYYGTAAHRLGEASRKPEAHPEMEEEGKP